MAKLMVELDDGTEVGTEVIVKPHSETHYAVQYQNENKTIVKMPIGVVKEKVRAGESLAADFAKEQALTTEELLS